jgi:acetyl esterase/lipase
MDYDLDPDLTEAAARYQRVDLETPETARDQIARMIATSGEGSAPANAQVLIEDTTISGLDGHPVPVRLYRPPVVRPPMPSVIYCHAGAFVLGDVSFCDPWALEAVPALGCVVVGVGYRLAPENPFPAAVDDCLAALRWTVDNADGIDIDRTRVAVAGGSSGGGLAASVCLRARDEGGPAVAFQLLKYPAVDNALATTSMKMYTDTPGWDAVNSRYMWKHYLGEDLAKPLEVSPYAAPARATNLSGMPPAYILTCEFDPLRDEGIAFAGRLLEAGVHVELHNIPRTFHEFDGVPDAPIAKRALAEQFDALRAAFAVA